MMPEIKYLIVTLIGIDIVFVVFFIFLIKRMNFLKQNRTIEKEIQVFESLVKDADRTAKQFIGQMQAKHEFVKRLNEQLDQRVASLNVLLNRSEILLASYNDQAPPDQGPARFVSSRRQEILTLAGDGCEIDEITKRLGISKSEVLLVLKLNKSVDHLKNETGGA